MVAGDMVDVVLVKDESKYGLPMPEEFEEVLNQDPEGDRLFHALGKGKQRSLLYLLSRSKDVDLRIHQALIVVEHLKENDGNIVGDVLNRQLKRPMMEY
ncbi:MAG: YdeI/OmpD-associated family protein [Pyrinomonadaceae bacterium]